MLGNAVTPNAARDLIAMAVEALTGESIELASPLPAPAHLAAAA